MIYGDIKNICANLYTSYVGNSFIETSAGSPTEFALYLQFVNNRIASYAQDFEFCKETGSVTLTGATSYNLKTLYPDFLTMYQGYGVNQNQEHPYYPNYIANVTPAEGFTLKGSLLIPTGNSPATGTFNFQYKSQYLVKDSQGVRKLNFTDDTDVSVLDDADINILIFGVGSYISWKADVASAQRKQEIKDWYQEAFNNLILRNQHTNQTHSVL